MSRNNGGGKGLKLDLKLNLSPPRENQYYLQQSSLVTTFNSPQYQSSMSTTTSSSMTSPPSSSCITSEMEEVVVGVGGGGLRYPSSPEAISMVLVGCPRCLMYVMLSEDDPKCPRCKSTALLDFLKDPKNSNKNKRSRKR